MIEKSNEIIGDVETSNELIVDIETSNEIVGEVSFSSSVESSYVLPIASDTKLGGIKVGENLTIDEDGTLNAQPGGNVDLSDYALKEELPTKTSELENDSNFINSIKTINNQSLVGEGNINIEGGTGGSAKYNYLVDGVRLYIDGVNGDDTNGDGSETKPFKTIYRFFDEANKVDGGRNDIRCYIVTPGEYVINEHSISNMVLHITGSVDGVILKFTTDRDVKFYQCHCNFNNITIDAPNATEVAFDGSNAGLTNCTINQMVRLFSGGGVLNGCVFRNFKGYYSNIDIKGSIGITNTSPTTDAFYFTNCVVRMAGQVNLAELTSNGSGVNCYLYCNNTFLTLQNTMPSNTRKYNYGFYGAGNVVVTNEKYKSALEERSRSGIVMLNTPTLFVTSDDNIDLSNILTKETDPTVPSWVKSITQEQISKWDSGDYELSPATNVTLGGIKVGTNLKVDIDGTLHAIGGGSGETSYEIPTLLYDNEEGDSSSITLTETLANFKYVEIYFSYLGDSWGYDYTKVYLPEGKLVNLMMPVLNNVYMYFSMSTWKLEGNTMTQTKGERWRIGVNPNITRAEGLSEILIHRVVGYKN